MSPARVGLLFALVASPACFSDTGFQGTAGLSQTGTTGTTGTTTAGSSSSGTSTGPATTTGTTGVDATTTTTGAATTSSSSGVGTLTGTTTDPATTDLPGCGGLGQACDNGCCGCLDCDPNTNLCGPSDAKCEQCEQCDLTGTCVHAPEATPCVAADSSCGSLVWGLVGTSCRAQMPGHDACDGEGTCVAGPCTGPGDEIASCGSAECLRNDVCAPGSPAAAVTVNSLCMTNQTTAGCKPTCSNEFGFSSIEELQCDPAGTCVKLKETDCGPFKCNELTNECLTKCTKNNDCIEGHTCSLVFMKCN